MRELPALPQGRWFTCALGRGSDGDGLTYLTPGSVFVDSFKDLKPPAVESGCQDVRCSRAGALRIDVEGVKTLIFDDSFKDLKLRS